MYFLWLFFFFCFSFFYTVFVCFVFCFFLFCFFVVVFFIYIFFLYCILLLLFIFFFFFVFFSHFFHHVFYNIAMFLRVIDSCSFSFVVSMCVVNYKTKFHTHWFPAGSALVAAILTFVYARANKTFSSCNMWFSMFVCCHGQRCTKMPRCQPMHAFLCRGLSGWVGIIRAMSLHSSIRYCEWDKLFWPFWSNVSL